jgi:hypothetical protein
LQVVVLRHWSVEHCVRPQLRRLIDHALEGSDGRRVALRAVENRLQDAGCYQKSGVEEFFPSFSHAGYGPILLTRAQANSILGLEKDPSFKRFTDCARYAGLPLDENGKMQVAWAQDWMEKAIQEAHREATQPEPGSNRPEARPG